jgi:hypothetical protein
MVDIYGNLLVASSTTNTTIDIMATYLDHNDWPSPIGIADFTNWQQIFGQNIAGIALDESTGLYSCQITIYKAGKFTLNVKANTLDVKDSAYPTITVEPTNIYAPACVSLGIPATMVAGTTYTFQV